MRAPNPDLRNPTANVTTLSGDLGRIGDNTDDTKRIITVPNGTSGMTIDGFTVRDAYAFGPIDGGGAGILVKTGTININNCIFLRNYGEFGGAGLEDDGGGTISNCVFEGNQGGLGGALFLGSVGSPPEADVLNCIFVGNKGTTGGAIALETLHTPKIINCTITANTASSNGSAIYTLSDASLLNCIVYGNTVTATGGGNTFYPMTPSGNAGNFIDTTNPLFVRTPSIGADSIWGTADDDYGDLHLKTTSTLIDKGDNPSVPATLTTDLDGHDRLVDIPNLGNSSGVIVDPGAYEASAAFAGALTANVPTSSLKLTLTINAAAQTSTIQDSDLTVTNVDTAVPLPTLHSARTTNGSFTVGELDADRPASRRQLSCVDSRRHDYRHRRQSAWRRRWTSSSLVATPTRTARWTRPTLP